MKRIYFVRHGETRCNVDQTVQGWDDALTPFGEIQASKIAERAISLPITRCISSKMLRARQTASYIEKAVGLSFEYSDLFHEILRPSVLFGEPRSSEAYRAYRENETEHANDDWHYSDEENILDRMERGRNALIFLESQPEEDILVVTHGHFLRLMVSLILTKGQISPDLWIIMNRGFWTSHTNLTVCTFDAGEWRLMTWNDHTHFGDATFKPGDH